MRSFHSFWLFAILLLLPFAVLAVENKKVTYTNGSVKEDGKGFLEFKLVEGKTDKAKCKLVTHDADKLNFKVAIPNDCSVRNETLFFSYGSCNASIERSSNSFKTYNLSEKRLYLPAISDVDFFLNQTHANISGIDDNNEGQNRAWPLGCKVKTLAYNPGRFLIDFSFWADVSLSCNVSIKFNASNYEIEAPRTTAVPSPVKSIEEAGNNSLLYIVLGSIAAGLVLLVIIVLLITYCVTKNRKKKNSKDLDNIDKAPDVRVSGKKGTTMPDGTKNDKESKNELKEVSCLSKTPKKSKDASDTALKVSTGIPPTRPLSATTEIATPSPTVEDGKPTAADFLFYGSLPKPVQEKMGIHEDIVQWSENRRRKAMEKELEVNQPSDVEVEVGSTNKSQDAAPAKEPQAIPDVAFGKEQFEPMVQRKGSDEVQGTQDSDD